MKNFVKVLKASKISQLCIRTDFWLEMSEANIFLFMNALPSMPALKNLEIQSSSRFHIDIVPPKAFLPLRQAARLETLLLEDFQVTAAHAEFINSLAFVMESHTSLKHITLNNFFASDYTNSRPHVLDPLVWSLSTIPNLVHLELTGCGSSFLVGPAQPLVSPVALSRLLQKNRLEVLCLEFLELNDDHLEAMAQQFASMDCRLHHVALNYHKMGPHGFRSLMKYMASNASVKSLSLRALCEIGSEGFLQAMTMLQHNYTIESLCVTATPAQQAELDLHLRLNGAGRSLLRNPQVTMEQWVHVLAKCNHDVDVTRHLLPAIPGLLSMNSGAA